MYVVFQKWRTPLPSRFPVKLLLPTLAMGTSPRRGYVFHEALLTSSDSMCCLDFYKNDVEIGHVSSRENLLTSQGSSMFLFELQEVDTVFLKAANGCIMSGSKNNCSFSWFKIN